MADALDPHKKAQLLQIFETLDGDEDGLLVLGDLMETGLDHDDAKKVFDQLDTEKSGHVDFSTFMAGYHLLDLDLDDDDEDLADSDDELIAAVEAMHSPRTGSPGSPSPKTPQKSHRRKSSVGSRGSSGKPELVRRTSIADRLKMEELERPRNFDRQMGGRCRRSSITSFEHAKTTKSHEERMAKIIEWCGHEGAEDTAVAFNEIEATMQYLARPFTEEEDAHVMELMKARGYTSITLGTLGRVMRVVQSQEVAAKEASKKSGKKLKWDDDRFVHNWTVALKEALREPGAGVLDNSHEEEMAALQNEVRQLRRSEEAAKKKASKVSAEASRLDEENSELRDRVTKLESERKRMSVADHALVEQDKTIKEKSEEMKARMNDMEHELGIAKKEYNNMSAMLKVERKIKKTQGLELTDLRKTVNNLQQKRSEANKMTLSKKVGKMKGLAMLRQNLRKLQVANQKLPELEADNKQLKEKITKLEADIKEYLRLMDSFQHSQNNNALDMPEDNLGAMMKDDEMERRVKELEALLEEERRLRKELEEEIERLKAEIASLQEALAEEKAARKALEEEIAALKARIAELESEVNGLKGELEATKAMLEQEKTDRAADVERLEKIIADLEAQIADLKKQLEDEIAHRKRLQAQLDELGSDAAKKLALLMEEMEALKKRLAELEKELADEKAKNAELETKLADETARRTAAEEELAKTKADLEAALKRIAELEAENAALKETLADHEVETVTIYEEKQYVEPQFVPPPMNKKKLKLTPEQQAEITAYATCFNQKLAGDEDLAHLMPINVETPELLLKVSDGLLLAKFINATCPDTIDERAMNMREDEDLTSSEILDNLTLVLSSALSIGVTMKANDDGRGENLGASAAQLQLMDCEDPQPSIDYIFQLVRSMFTQTVNVRSHPELAEICETPTVGLSKKKLSEVSPRELKGFGPEELLMRWSNFHTLANAANDNIQLVKSFKELKNGQGHMSCLSRVSEKSKEGSPIEDTAKTDGSRARLVLESCKKLGITHFFRPSNITSGNERLNMLLSAVVFNHSTGLVDEADMANVNMGDDDGKELSGDQREERAFRMWMNGAIPGVFINDLFLDCMDGLTLLRVIDYIEPGHVNWKNVEMKPTNKFKCVSNCNYAVKLAKNAPLGCSLVGIDGPDIVDGHEQFILAIVWQLSRYHTLKKLENLLKSQGKGARITDDMILKWANEMVASNHHSSNPMDKCKSFRDNRLNDGLFVLNLIYAIEPRVVEWKMVQKGESNPEKIRNAGYAISLARKLGAEIFLLPHDIVEVKPKMLLLLVGSLMSLHSHRGNEKANGENGSSAVDELVPKIKY